MLLKSRPWQSGKVASLWLGVTSTEHLTRRLCAFLLPQILQLWEPRAMDTHFFIYICMAFSCSLHMPCNIRFLVLEVWFGLQGSIKILLEAYFIYIDSLSPYHETFGTSTAETCAWHMPSWFSKIWPLKISHQTIKVNFLVYLWLSFSQIDEK